LVSGGVGGGGGGPRPLTPPFRGFRTMRLVEEDGCLTACRTSSGQDVCLNDCDGKCKEGLPHMCGECRDGWNLVDI
jgi:hypothetical protein